MSSSWEVYNEAQITNRNRREVLAYRYLTSQLAFRNVYAETSCVLATLRDKGPLGAGYASREQLEQRCARLQHETEQLRAAHEDGLDRERSLNEGLTVLKNEHRALFDENERLQTLKEAAVSESELFSTELVKAKHNNAELMQRLFESEQVLLAIKRGEAPPASPKDPHNNVANTYADPGECGNSRGAGGMSSLFTQPSSPVGGGAGGEDGSGYGASAPPGGVCYERENTHEGDVQGLAFTENGKQIWTGGADKFIRSWDAKTGKPIAKIPAVAGVLSLNTCGEVLVAGCVDSTIRVWMIGKDLRGKCQLTGHSEKVVSVAVTSDARFAFSTSTDRTVKRWDIGREQLTGTIVCLSGCNDVASVNDKVATAHHDGIVRLYDSRDAKEAGKIRLHDKPITSVRISTDGLKIATLSKDNTIKVCDLRTQRQLFDLTHQNLTVGSNIQRLAISPDGRYCATGSTSGLVYVWDCNMNGKLVSTLSGHAGHVSNVAWNPQGQGLVAIGSDRKMILFM